MWEDIKEVQRALRAINTWMKKCVCARFKIGHTVIDGEDVEWDGYVYPIYVFNQCVAELDDHIDDCGNLDCPHQNMTDEKRETLLPFYP